MTLFRIYMYYAFLYSLILLKIKQFTVNYYFVMIYHFILQPGSLSGIITIQMLRVGNQSSSQLFHAFCCAPTTNEKYRSRSVSVFVWVDGKGTLPFDWTNIPGLQRVLFSNVLLTGSRI